MPIPLIAGLASLAMAAQRAAAATVLALMLLSLGAGTALLHRQKGHAAPMLPVDLLRRPLFALSVATSMASFTTQGLAFVSLPFFIEGVLQREAVQTGFLMAPIADFAMHQRCQKGVSGEVAPPEWAQRGATRYEGLVGNPRTLMVKGKPSCAARTYLWM